MVKTKLSDEIIEKICENIEEGIPQKYSAQLAGISKSTFYRWLERGKKAKSGKFKKFYERVSWEKSKNVSCHVKNFHKACENKPELSLKWLALNCEEFREKKETNTIHSK